MRNFLCLLCLLGLCLTASPRAEAFSVSAEAAFLLDADSGRVLFEKNADVPMLIASTTKVMTALIVLETCEDMDELVTVRPELIAVEGSCMYLKANEQVSVRELLYGLMLMSGNDAAMVLADHCCGSVEAFVERMNERADELGLENTRFANPHGLDRETHHSSARDMANITAEAMKNELFAQIVASPSAEINGRVMRNHNKLLRLYPDAVGVKTGFTRAAGRCLVSAARRDGRLLIAVTLKAPDDWNDHIALFNYGFSHTRRVTVLKSGAALRMVPVVGGVTPGVSTFILQDITLTLTEQERDRIQILYETPPFLWAPAGQNHRIGSVIVTLDGQELARSALFAKNEVPLRHETSDRPFLGVLSEYLRKS